MKIHCVVIHPAANTNRYEPDKKRASGNNPEVKFLQFTQKLIGVKYKEQHSGNNSNKACNQPDDQ